MAGGYEAFQRTRALATELKNSVTQSHTEELTAKEAEQPSVTTNSGRSDGSHEIEPIEPTIKEISGSSEITARAQTEGQGSLTKRALAALARAPRKLGEAKERIKSALGRGAG
jgi:hypothetical protein